MIRLSEMRTKRKVHLMVDWSRVLTPHAEQERQVDVIWGAHSWSFLEWRHWWWCVRHQSLLSWETWWPSIIHPVSPCLSLGVECRLLRMIEVNYHDRYKGSRLEFIHPFLQGYFLPNQLVTQNTNSEEYSFAYGHSTTITQILKN